MASSKNASVRARAIKTVVPFMVVGLLVAGCVQGASVETPLSESFIDVLERLPNSPLPPAPEPEPEVVDTLEGCEVFCEAVATNCVDDNALFDDDDACLAACAEWPSDPDFEEGGGGDSLECRTWYAGTPAEEDPETNCLIAAADGGGVCVDIVPALPCETFCTTVLEKCTDDNEVYADEEECVSACEGWTSNPDYVDGEGGDSAECRAYYAGDPIDEDPEANCPAVSADGGGICYEPPPVLPCDTYCELALANCIEDNALYADDAECQAACAEWPSDPDYEPGVGGDSIECRTYHVGTPSAEEPEIHCLHAAPDGGGVCIVPVEPGTCETDEDCLILDDGNYCNGGFTCAEGLCYEVPKTVECDQVGTGTCTERVCDPTTGGCVEMNKANGSYCNADGDQCTVEDRCEDGQCVTGKRLYCDDGNPCTTDECKAGSCKYTNTSSPSCDDGNPCTTDETCSGGICTGKSSECSCGSDEDCAIFDDGNLCNGTLECKSGKCK
ncbi:MAG: hypothetical protein VX938_00490, partial [Myxococcota bacterium]|nr:hypothetical protein [Myxococcota bacterium]